MTEPDLDDTELRRELCIAWRSKYAVSALGMEMRQLIDPVLEVRNSTSLRT